VEMSLAYIDLDNFKSINDTYGHAVGDQVIMEFSRIIRGIIRKSDLVGRVGGEEFALLVHGAGAKDAHQLLERLLAEIRLQQIETPAGKLNFTASAGLVHISSYEQKQIHILLADADKALNHAKRTGKDRVVAFEANLGVSMPA